MAESFASVNIEHGFKFTPNDVTQICSGKSLVTRFSPFPGVDLQLTISHEEYSIFGHKLKNCGRDTITLSKLYFMWDFPTDSIVVENLKLLAGEEIKLEELGIPDDMTQEEDYNYFFHEYAILFKVCVPEGKNINYHNM